MSDKKEGYSNIIVYDFIQLTQDGDNLVYPTKGDPFPWTFSPLKYLTFYSIDS